MDKKLVFDFITIAVIIGVIVVMQPQHAVGSIILGVLFAITVVIVRLTDRKE